MKYAAEEGARVINLSYGREGFPSWYEQDMIDFLTETYHVVFVASGGNTFTDGPYFPASYNNVLAVGHSNSGDQRTGSTTHNYFLDVLAPGAGVASIQNGGGYNNSITGSSYAAPFVAGIAALLIEKFPSLTGQQIAELIRTTADDVYGISPNNSHPFKLGKGRVNARRALTEKDTRPAIRMSDYTFSSSVGRQILFGGETLTLHCDFTNYLAPSSSNLQVSLSLSEDSPNCDVTVPNVLCTDEVNITTGTATLGVMNTLETLTRDFTVDINTSEYWKRVQFKLTITDTGTGYSDYQYFDVYIRPSITTKLNRFSIGMNTDGRLGWTGTLSAPVTPGFFYDNLADPLGNLGRTHAPIIKRAGLLVANAEGTKVIDAVPSAYTAGNPVVYTAENDDFTSLKDMRLFDNFPNQEVSFQGTFDDLGRTPPGGSIGLEIDHKIIGYRYSTDLDYVVLEYNIKNKSGSDLDSLHVGLFLDWDLHGLTQPTPNFFSPLPYQANQVAWNDNEQIGYVYNTTAGQYLGVHILNPNPSYYALDLNAANIGSNGVDIDPITAGFSEAEKYQALANRIAKKEVSTGSDVAQVIGTTFYQFPNSQSRKMVMIIFFSPDEANLVTVKNKALARINPLYNKAVQPNINLTSNCPAGTLQLTPQVAGTYNFYRAPNFDYPIYTGGEYTVQPEDIGKVFHVTALNATLESNPTIVDSGTAFTISSIADFNAPSTVNRSIEPNVTFTNNSSGANTYEWNFGDGSAVVNTVSPTHNYKAEGTYTVGLTINKGTPCQVVKTQDIVVQSQSPLPLVTTPITANEGDNVTVSPTGGSNFKFFDAVPPTANLLNTGSSYTINSISANQNIFVVNIDSALESSAVEVKINVTPAVAAPTLSDFSVCSGEQATVTPLPANGIFRFYSALPIASGNLLSEGSSYTTLPLTSPQTLYVTKIEGVNESTPTTLNITLNTLPAASFSAPTTVNRTQNQVVNFTNLSSADVVNWQWDFGDGSPQSTLENPQHSFNRQGTFTVTLVVENGNGCKSQFQKLITIESESPAPIIASMPPICPSSEVTISPTNGTNFKFYAENSLSTLLKTGSTYTISNFTASTSVFVVNVDSALQSSPTEVALLLNPVSVDFEADTEMSLAANGSIKVHFSTEQEAEQYLWDFGNGNLVEGGKNASYNFASESTFEVQLTITDNLGCSVSRTKNITVKATRQIVESGTVPPTNLPTAIPIGGTATTPIPFLQLGNDLVIEANAQLTVPNNSTLLVEGNTLIRGTLIQGENAKIILKGNLTVDGGKMIGIEGSSPRFTFQNTAPVTIQSVQPMHFNQLFLEGETVTLATELHIYHTLSLMANNLVTSPLFGLVLHSNVDKTAILLNNAEGVVQGNNVKIQRFIPNNSRLEGVQVYNGTRYHYLASPIANFPITALDDEIVTGNFELKIDPLWNNPNGQGIPANLFPNTFLYDEKFVATQSDNATAGWRVPPFNSNMEEGRGYAVRIDAGTTLTYKGTPNNGSILIPISRSNNTENTLENTGWALLGNPYPSPMSTTSFLQENTTQLEDALFMYVATGEFSGFYAATTSAGFTVPSFINLDNIAAGQGFFVRKENNGQSNVHFNNEMRRDANATFYRKSAEENEILAHLQISQNTHRHETLIAIGSQGENLKGLAPFPNFADFTTAIYHTDISENKWLISSVNDALDTLSIHLRLEMVGNAKIKLLSTYPEKTIWLEDRLQKHWHNLSEQPNYRFTTTQKDVQNRFFLHFKSKGFFEKNTFVSLENNQLTIAFASYLEENPQVLIYDVLGRVITPVGNANFDGFEWNAQLPALPHQVLLVKISSALGVETQKMVR